MPSSRSKAKPRATRAPGKGEVQVAGVRLTNPERVLYPEQGITKRALAGYYEKVALHILPHVEGRPLSVVRCPEGWNKECFYQKHAYESFPDAVKSVSVKEKDGSADYLMVDTIEGIVGLVQMGVLEIHPWGSRRDRLDRPDRMFFDLDPAPELGWERVVDAARLMRELLIELGLESFVKTTGGKGLHLVVPIARRHSWDEVKGFSRAVAERVAQADPGRFIATASKAKRKGRIFIDYLRNAKGATAVAPFSTRARRGAPVSTPIEWAELESGVRSDSFDVESLPRRLARLKRDPWEGFLDLNQSLKAGMRRRLGLE